MVDPVDFLCCFLCFLACLLRVLRKYFSMALCSNSSGVGVAVVASSPWKRPVADLTAAGDDAASKRPREDQSEEEDRRAPQPVVVDEDCQGDVPREDVVMAEEKVVVMRERGRPARIVIPVAADEDCKADTPREDVVRVEQKVVAVVRERRRPARIVIPVVVDEDCKEDVPREDVVRVEKKVVVMRERRRPARIVIPVTEAAGFGVAEMVAETEADVGREMEEKGAGYCLASRRGSHRQVMEDGYGVISDIHGDSKQAFFGVFDGHGGRAAVDFVSAKLGGNILTALDELKTNESDDQTVQLAIKEAYLTTDREFLSQGLGSGVCAATVLLKDGELHVANVGDCRVVLCRKGTADALTDDHRAAREDERDRIENSRGFVTCRNGVWRVQDSLAVSRAIGDGSMKEWVISEPETSKIQLTPDCEFLILASDGLWDKVTNQEAVDVVSKQSDSMKSCKELIEMSCRRGNRDDVTVMVVHLEKFMSHQSG